MCWLVHIFSVWSLRLAYSFCAAYASATVVSDAYALLCFQSTLREVFPTWKLGVCRMIAAEYSTAVRFEGKFQFWSPWSSADQNDKVRNTGKPINLSKKLDCTPETKPVTGFNKLQQFFFSSDNIFWEEKIELSSPSVFSFSWLCSGRGVSCRTVGG